VPLFSTYEEAWASFAQADRMEDFADQYPADEAHLLTWHIPVASEDVPGVVALQMELTALDDLAAIPVERFHVSVAPAAVTDEPDPALEHELLHHAEQAWAAEPPFLVDLHSVNVFPTAVVVEVHGKGPAHLLDRLLESGYWKGLPWRAPNRDIFLPHLTVAIATRRRAADDVRRVVQGHRHEDFGTLEVDCLELCRIPVARSRLLQPWDVVGAIRLGTDG
jgi:2'-5' RNA ligase